MKARGRKNDSGVRMMRVSFQQRAFGVKRKKHTQQLSLRFCLSLLLLSFCVCVCFLSSFFFSFLYVLLSLVFLFCFVLFF